MFHKLTGGLLSAAYQNACCARLSRDTHMVVMEVDGIKAVGGHGLEVQTGEVSWNVSVKDPETFGDFQEAVGSLGRVVSVYSLSRFTKEECYADSDRVDEALEASKVEFDADGGVVQAATNNFDNVVELKIAAA